MRLAERVSTLTENGSEDGMSVESQPLHAANSTPAEPSTNGTDLVLRRWSRSQVLQATAPADDSLLPPRLQSPVMPRPAMRRTNTAIANGPAKAGLDVPAILHGPTWDEPNDDREPLSKRQKQATEQKCPNPEYLSGARRQKRRPRLGDGMFERRLRMQLTYSSFR